MKSLKYFLLICLLVQSYCCLQAQDIPWFTGTWYGETYFPNGPIAKRIKIKMKVLEVHGNSFTADYAHMYPKDTLIRLERRINGTFTSNNLVITKSIETYLLDPRSRSFWTDCSQCPTTVMFNATGEDISIKIVTINCGDACDGETVFHRSLNTFDSVAQLHLIKQFGIRQQKEDDRKTDSTMLVKTDEANTARREVDSTVVLTNRIVPKESIATPVIRMTEQPRSFNFIVHTDSSTIIATAITPAKQDFAVVIDHSKDSIYVALTQRTTNVVSRYKVGSPHIVVELFDNAQIDGDIVTVFHNNELLVHEQTLTHKPIVLTVDASAINRHHEFVLVADNEGLIPPNTALLRIKAGSQQFQLEVSSNMFNNAKIEIDYTGE